MDRLSDPKMNVSPCEPRLRVVASAQEAGAEAGVTASRAKKIALDPEISLDDALAAIIDGCLDHFTGNFPAFRATGQPETVHQMRVALRRLRAAIGMVRREIDCRALQEAAERAKALAATLGETRDWDVLHALLQSGPRRDLQTEASYYALLDAVERRRDEAHKRARTEIAAPQTDDFLQALRATVAERVWRRDHTHSTPGSARDFAARALSKLRRRVIKKSAGLAELSAQERHAARIALKKARYAAEFFESLFEKPARKYLKSIAHLQDELGAGNDAEMAARLLGQFSCDAGLSTSVWYARGWFAGAKTHGGASHSRHEKDIRGLTPFWT